MHWHKFELPKRSQFRYIVRVCVDKHIIRIIIKINYNIIFQNVDIESDEESDVLDETLGTLLGDAIRSGYDLLNVSSISEESSDSANQSFDTSVQNMNAKLDTISLQDDSETVTGQFGFKKYTVPPLLTRHPPPETGRDDDREVLRRVLDDVLLKLGHNCQSGKVAERKIIFGPDNKIGKNLLLLKKDNPKYEMILPEFPLLHVRKSKITVLFSGYQKAGLVEMLRFMRDEAIEDWTKLVSLAHIEAATRYVRRLSIALHVSFLIEFIKSLSGKEKEDCVNDFVHLKEKGMTIKWDEKLQLFMSLGTSRNATFALHADMMQHADEVAAVALAERLGGPQGYHLLLASVKSSLLFSYLNGAVAYAPFCTELILQHYSASTFDQNLKKCLFSTPISDSKLNFSGDTKREMDHITALKSFKSGSTLGSITQRMSLVDDATSVHRRFSSPKQPSQTVADQLGWHFDKKDWKHIMPTVHMVLRRGGLSREPNEIPFNVYTTSPTPLEPCILDVNSRGAGEYLLQKSLSKLHILGFDDSDIQPQSSVQGNKAIVDKVLKTKGTTVRRARICKGTRLKCQSEIEEEQRQKAVAKTLKQIQCFSSKQNTCQALVYPDGSKPKVQKSSTILKALSSVVDTCKKMSSNGETDHQIMYLNTRIVPEEVRRHASVATVEFAGIKFKTNAPSGSAYLKHVEKNVLTNIIKDYPAVKNIVVCEEKYSFTPDILKYATRKQRQVRKTSSVAHLKAGEQILSKDTFSRDAIMNTAEGKFLISNFLAENIHLINIESDLSLIVDSEFVTACSCSKIFPCTLGQCDKFCTPVIAHFTEEAGYVGHTNLTGVHQRKGEAELAQVDWIFHYLPKLGPGEGVVSIVTSGDIDAVLLHMYAVSLHWPRENNNLFTHPVYVVLQKPHRMCDIFCITELIQLLDKSTNDKNMAVKIAMTLTIGGNDFIPKPFGISHSKCIDLFLSTSLFQDHLFNISDGIVKINVDQFIEFYKYLYTPKKVNAAHTPFDEVRRLTFVARNNTTNSTISSHQTRNPQQWLPPKSCLSRLCKLVEIVGEYMATAGKHDAHLPNFIDCSCLKVTSDVVEYDFGPDAHENISERLRHWNIDETPTKATAHGTVKRGSKNSPSKKDRKSKKKLF